MGFELPPLDNSKVEHEICRFIRRMVEEVKSKGLVLGLSGGLDSSVTAYLAVKALGSERVKALIMPHNRVTPRFDVEDAWMIADRLGIEAKEIDIAPMCDAIIERHPYKVGDNVVAIGNVMARVRMILLYYMANTMNMLVCGSGDKSEIMIGYFTKYGDGGVDILPIGDLYKTDVKRIARYLGVPDRIILKPSSPRLWPGQTAEEELGLSYDFIDPILYLVYEKGLSPEDAASRIGVDLEAVMMVIRRVEGSRHKRLMPPSPAVSHLRTSLSHGASLSLH
ncbi:MAG: NAD+ synthase [Candidatus Nezhaarchaeota archaeon]|nr:NAD+ synthase [Candidatus Nezhaarchaeota archaeon]MCX8141189.1 NAD+ synthase [Candidatus Nezhaarchaeota archaeon]MDW8049455.1 NAD+ synthase [Nitrososphaerota archaeon]